VTLGATAAKALLGSSFRLTQHRGELLEFEWLVDQLDPRGDALVAAVAIADQFVLTLPLSYGDHHPEMAGVSIGEYGHTPDTTVGQVVRATPIVAPLAAQYVLST
jgi:hypothetical protein